MNLTLKVSDETKNGKRLVTRYLLNCGSFHLTDLQISELRASVLDFHVLAHALVNVAVGVRGAVRRHAGIRVAGRLALVRWK